MQKEKIPFKVLAISEALAAAGGQVFIVGGAVRDLLMGMVPSDWDLATDLTPEEVLSIFPAASTVGIEFGRLSVGDVDIVSMREESNYSDLRHPQKVKFNVPLEKDLERRDFTVNSMALDPFTMELFDPMGGRDDLNLRILTTVGDPVERFKEDPLRILRAIRFKAELGFNLDPGTVRGMVATRDLVKEISSDRIFNEIKRILLSNGVYHGIMDLYSYGIGPIILPGVFGRSTDDMERTALSLSYAGKDLALRLSVLYYGSDTEELFRVFNLPSSLVKEVRTLALHSDPETIPDPRDVTQKTVRVNEDLAFDSGYLVRKILWSLGEQVLFKIIDAKIAIGKGSGRWSVPPGAAFLMSGFTDDLLITGKKRFTELSLKGEDIKEILGVGPGPVVGEAISYLTEAVLRDPGLNEKEVLKKLLLDWRSKNLGKSTDEDLVDS